MTQASRPYRVGLLLLAVIPALLIARAIAVYGVNAPFGDEWSISAMFQKYEAGDLSFHDFYVQHNEHRILIPRLCYFLIALATGGNAYAQMFFTWSLAVVISALLWVLLRRWQLLSVKGALAYLIPINILLFSATQYENWLWGLQSQFYLPYVGTVGGLVIAGSRKSLRFRFSAGALLCLVTTFALANGLFTWLLVGPAIFLLPGRETGEVRRSRWIVAWVAVTACVWLAYFIGYHFPASSHDPSSAASGVTLAAEFFLVLLGLPLGFGRYPSNLHLIAAIGALVLLAWLFCAAVTALGWRDLRFRLRTLPWFLLSLHAVASCVLGAAGRFRGGLLGASSPRYSLQGAMLLIALVVLVPRVVSELRRRGWVSVDRVRLRYVYAGVAAVMAALFVDASVLAYYEMGLWRASKTRGKAGVNLIHFGMDPAFLAKYATSDLTDLAERADCLSRLGLLQPPTIRTRAMTDIARPGAGLRHGKIDASGVDGDDLCFVGWAALPEQRRPADAVLLCFKPPDLPEKIMVATVNLGSRDSGSSKPRDPDYEESDWLIRFKKSMLAPGWGVTVYAYDCTTGAAYPIE